MTNNPTLNLLIKKKDDLRTLQQILKCNFVDEYTAVKVINPFEGSYKIYLTINRFGSGIDVEISIQGKTFLECAVKILNRFYTILGVKYND